MCYHKQDKALKGQLEKYYDAIMRDFEYSPSYYENGFDFKASPIITAERPKELLGYNWGFVPWWVKSEAEAKKLRVQTLNCISEEMYDKASYKDSAKEGKRCLIPATGFFEWRWLDAKGKAKIPYFIHAKNQEIFSIAGLYNSWHDKASGEELNTYTVLTTAANPLLTKIHNSKKRMPVILKKEYEKDWLNPNLTKDDVLALCQPLAEGYLDAHPIGKKVGTPAISTDEKNNPDIEKPVEYPELGLLDA